MYCLSIITIFLILFFPWSITSNKFLNFLNQFQYTYRFLIIPQILLSFIFALIIVKYIKSIKNRNILITLAIIFTLIFQLLGQCMYINSHINTTNIDKFAKNHDINNITSYKITDQSGFYKITNNKDVPTTDYIPKRSYLMSKYVNNYYGFYNHNNLMHFNNISYNRYNFKYKDKINNISLPIYMYNNEKIHVYLNGKKINYSIDKYGLLTLNNIHSYISKNNNVYIESFFYNFRIIGLFISILGLLFVLIIIGKTKLLNNN